MVRVLVVGQTPPPFNGQAVMIERLVKSELAGVELIHARMGFSSHMNELGRVRISKILHLFGLIARIIYHRFADNVRILYYPPAGADRVPIVRDLAILLSTRWLFDKTIFHFHAGGGSELYQQLPAWQRWLFRRAYFQPDAAILLSPLSSPDGRRLEAKRDWIIPNGIEDPCPEMHFSRASAAANNTRAGHDDRLRMLFVGVLSEAKGVMVLVEACGKLAARGVPFQLELVGQWESEEFSARVRKRIEELKLGRQVQVLGMLVGDEKFSAYRRADVFCFPTSLNCEGLPIVVLEAMACGLPVVATRWRGIPSAVDEGKSGFLVEIRDPESLADRLAKFADDPRLRERMGREGRAKFEREYTLSRHLKRMHRVLLETAGVHVHDEVESDGDATVGHPLELVAANCATAAHVATASA